MRITVPAFTGLNKLTAIQRLKDSEASEAVNCDFRSGDLRAFYDDKSAGTTTQTDANGVTLFDYTQTQELIANGIWDIVRSPVVNDQFRRCYFSRYQPPDANPYITSYVGVVDKDNVADQGGGLAYLTSTKRLGVPQPAAFSAPPLYEIRSGDILGKTLSTKDDATINILTTKAAKLNTSTKLIINSPGFPTSPLPIIKIVEKGGGDTTLSVITLSGNKKTWKNCEIIETTTSANNVKTTVISFKLSGHGLVTGDQVAISLRSQGMSWPSNFPANVQSKLWSVTGIDVNSFSLDGLSPKTNSTTVGTTSSSVAKFSVFAPSSSGFPDLSATAIDNATAPYQSSLTLFALDATTTFGTWADAATIDTVRSRSYCATFVDIYGDESAPCAPTDPIDVAPGSPVVFANGSNANIFPTTAKQSGQPLDQYAAITKVRLYRTDETGTFRLVTTEIDDTDTITWAEATSPTFVYTDTKTDAHLGEPLLTTGWYPPPQGVQGIISAPNGVVIGFKDRTIYPSVPYVPYAFPVAYQLATDADIMGLVATSSGVAVLTKQMPYLLTGTDPSGYSMVKLEVPQACVSHTSIVDMGSFGIYASPNGLVAINGAEIELVTADLLTRVQWQAYNPTSIIGGHSDGRYIGSYVATDGTRKGFMFDTRTATFSDLSMGALGFYNDLFTDSLKFVDPTGAIKIWNQQTTRKTYYWVSKAFELPKPCTFGVAQIIAPTEAYQLSTLTMKLYGWDGVQTTLVATFGTNKGVTPDGMYPLPNVTPFRVPVTLRYTAYKLSLEGDVSVAMVSFASTMDELKEV